MILLEYHPKQGFHNNTCIPERNKFSSVLFSNGWKPVCIIPADIQHDPELEALTDRLEEELPPYETVVNEVVFWVMKTLQCREPEL